MAANEIRVGDVGTVLRATIKDGSTVIDVSSVDSKKMLFRKPSGKTFEKDAAFTTDGTDGKVQYVTEAGVLDEDGIWQMQARIGFVGGNQWTTDIEDFEVYRNIR